MTVDPSSKPSKTKQKLASSPREKFTSNTPLKLVEDENHKIITAPRVIIAALIAIIFLIFFWSFLRARIIDSVTKQLQQARQQGYLVDHQALNITGFPFALNLDTNQLHIQSPSRQSPNRQSPNLQAPNLQAPNRQTPIRQISNPKHWSVRLAELRASTKTLTPLVWQITHHGTARIDLRAPNGKRYLFNMVPAPVTMDVKMGLNRKIKRQTLTIRKTRLQPLIGNPPPITALQFLSLRSQRYAQSNVFTITGDQLQLSAPTLGPFRTALGPKIDTVNAHIRVDNWDKLLENPDQYRRDGNNHIRSKEFRIVWGALDIVGDFDLGFKRGQLDGSIFLHVKNLGSILDRLPKDSLFSTLRNGKVKQLLSMLETDNQGRQEIEIRIQNRKVKYGFMTLYKY